MSEFQDLPLPAIRDHADYPRIVPPGQTVEIPAVGDFIYCKASDSELKVIINGKTTRMEAGDKRRVGSVFRGVVLENTSAVPIVCTFVIGFGDFDRVIVRGEITAELKLRTADGSYIDDTRKTEALNVIPVAGTGITENCGEIVKTLDNGFSYVVDNGTKTIEAANIIVADYNPAVHDGIIVMAPASGLGNMWGIEIDPITGALIRDLGKIADLGQPSAITRFGNFVYQKNTFNTKGIYKKPIGSGSWELVVSGASNDPNLTVDDEGNLYSTGFGYISKWSPAGESLGSVDTLESRITLGWYKNQIWALPDANYTARYYTKDLEYVGQTSCTMAGTEGRVMYGPYTYQIAEDTGIVSIKATETVVDLLAGKAFLQCENQWLNKRPTAFDAFRTTADITVTNAETGNPTVSGELIKMIFEWYTGAQAPDDYMDYIFGFECVGSVDINGISFPKIEIASQGQTLLAAGVVDNFSNILPFNVRITVDNRIQEFL